ncbi:protein PET100 homolog, mitochondrial isoform X1 [Alexandromys fortis]|uniref:protein PET100 homolog, mitochondrial isoform X1 n=1 Tax=Alexandromys fortis TaxID=100897 RepID=UPI0021533D0E|nr:uncharacterized protein LOC126491605 isoform X1 [Microtus fortis]
MVIGNERRVERGVPRRKYLRFVLKLSGMSSRCGGLKWRVWVWSEEAFQRGMKGGFRSRAGFPEGEPRAPNRCHSTSLSPWLCFGSPIRQSGLRTMLSSARGSCGHQRRRLSARS